MWRRVSNFVLSSGNSIIAIIYSLSNFLATHADASTSASVSPRKLTETWLQNSWLDIRGCVVLHCLLHCPPAPLERRTMPKIANIWTDARKDDGCKLSSRSRAESFYHYSTKICRDVIRGRVYNAGCCSIAPDTGT